MHIKLITLVFFILGMMPVLVGAQVDKEKEAIKEVIIKETTSFMNVDRPGWASSWLHTPYVYWSYADSTGSSYTEGWEGGISKTFDTYFKTQKPSKAKISYEWIEIRLYNNGAFVRFIQKSTDNFDTDETSQIRVMEKKDGKWKVVCVGVVARYAKK